MSFIIFLIIFGLAGIYISGKIKTDNEYLQLYSTWVITLIVINILVSVFIYMFTHSVKKGQGNRGVRGKIGRRGPEGKSDLCIFKCEQS